MNFKRFFAILFAVLILAGCHSKKAAKDDFVPIGWFPTEADARAMAKKQQELQKELRQQMAKNGTRPEDLPCGTFKVVTTHNADGKEFWGIQKDMTGCPGNDGLKGAPGSSPVRPKPMEEKK